MYIKRDIIIYKQGCGINLLCVFVFHNWIKFICMLDQTWTVNLPVPCHNLTIWHFFNFKWSCLHTTQDHGFFPLFFYFFSQQLANCRSDCRSARKYFFQVFYLLSRRLANCRSDCCSAQYECLVCELSLPFKNIENFGIIKLIFSFDFYRMFNFREG